MIEPTNFKIEELKIITTSGEVDVSAIFEELNIFDNLFMPCMSGNIVIRDSINLINLLKFDGSEFIKIQIDKGDAQNSIGAFLFNRTFRIQKIANRTNMSQTSQIYTLHFVSKEMLISEQTKVQHVFKNKTYSEMAMTILTQYLGVPNQVPEIFVVVPTQKRFDIVVPNITPFEALDWFSRRAIFPGNGKPDYVFYQQPYGYSFASLSYLMDRTRDPSWIINTTTKDVDNSLGNELLGARDLKVMSYGTVKDAIQNGVYGGTFIGFDPLIRVWEEKVHTFSSLYKNSNYHLNPYPNVPENSSLPEGGIDGAFSKARIAAYPYELQRKPNEWLLEHDPIRCIIKDNEEDYIFQRKHTFGLLAEKRLQLTMAGNFGLFSGSVVELEVPKFAQFSKSNETTLDPFLSGRYLISGVRHIIKYDRHETLIEICSDSNKEPK